MDKKRGKGRPTEINKTETARLTKAEKKFIDMIRGHKIKPDKAALALDHLLELEGEGDCKFIYVEVKQVQDEEEEEKERKAS